MGVAGLASFVEYQATCSFVTGVAQFQSAHRAVTPTVSGPDVEMPSMEGGLIMVGFKPAVALVTLLTVAACEETLILQVNV